MNGSRLGLAGLVLVIVGIVVTGAGAVLSSNAQTAGQGSFGGMMGGSGYGPGMMGGSGMMGSQGGIPSFDSGPQPDELGFVAGTIDTPRVIDVIAGPGYSFAPSTIAVQHGETVTFRVTTMGPLAHDFMVGPAEPVAADEAGTPEVTGIAMMETRSLTYTFDGSGPYAFACHVPGHHEAGMTGTITLAG